MQPIPLTDAERARCPNAHPAYRSARGFVGNDGLKVSILSTRIGSLISPAMVLADYAAGRAKAGQHRLVPDQSELVLVTITER